VQEKAEKVSYNDDDNDDDGDFDILPPHRASEIPTCLTKCHRLQYTDEHCLTLPCNLHKPVLRLY